MKTVHVCQLTSSDSSAWSDHVGSPSALPGMGVEGGVATAGAGAWSGDRPGGPYSSAGRMSPLSDKSVSLEQGM